MSFSQQKDCADFGDEINVLLNSIGWFLKNNELSAFDGETVFNMGIAAHKNHRSPINCQFSALKK